MVRHLLILLSVLFSVTLGDHGSITNRITCEHSTLNLECSFSYHIKVIEAAYGRSDSSVCSTNKNLVNNTECKTKNSKGIVGRRCDGKRSCVVGASNGVFGDPCYGTYKYLNVSYGCVPQPSQEVGIDVQCESNNYKYATCDIPTKKGMVQRVSLKTQLSKTSCREGVNFGTREGLIWVNEGCRGNFSVYYQSEQLYDYFECPSGSWWSKNEHECWLPYVRNITKLSLMKRFSTKDCTYELKEELIKVNKGCHAIFNYTYTIKEPQPTVCFGFRFDTWRFGVKEIVGVIAILLVVMAIAKLSHMRLRSRTKMKKIEEEGAILMDLTMEMCVDGDATALYPKNENRDV